MYIFVDKVVTTLKKIFLAADFVANNVIDL